MSEDRTSQSLLQGLRDPDDAEAWREFVDLHTPLVFAFCRRRGLSEADASDVAQEVMRAVAGAIGSFEYDPDRGTFRSWFFTVARRKLYNFLRKEQRRPRASEGAALMHLVEERPDPHEERDWELDYRRQVFRWAARTVRSRFSEQSWRAFWRTAVDNADPLAVAKELGTSRGAVYAAKARVIGALRDCIRRVGGEWEIDGRRGERPATTGRTR